MGGNALHLTPPLITEASITEDSRLTFSNPALQLHINDGIALHAVRCADDTDCEEGAVTLHLYAPPTKKVWLFEPGADRVVQRVPGYHSVGGVVSAQEA